MKIVRGPRPEDNFTIVANADIDAGLSLKAMGLYVWLISRPPNWSTTIERVAEAVADGEYAVRGAMKELEAVGLVGRSRERSEDGTWTQVLTLRSRWQPPAVSAQGGAIIATRKPRTAKTAPLSKKEEGSNKKEEQEGASAPTDFNSRAHRIAQAIFDARDAANEPRPPTFPKVLAAVAAMLRAGWEDAAVQRAALAVPTISIGWIETELRRCQPKSGHCANSVEADAHLRETIQTGRVLNP